ncbi:MAG: sulfatase-like hydrolase/transferase [Saprospiraceae bacterium]
MTERKIWPPLAIILKLYLLAILVFTIFRGILFLTETKRLNEAVSTGLIIQAFIMGLRFDLVISSYILFFPFLMLASLDIAQKRNEIVLQSLQYLTTFLFLLSFMVCATDIPYFNQFFKRFTVDAFMWMDSPEFVFSMILQEPRYWLALIPFLLLSYGFIKITQKYWKQYKSLPIVKNSYFKKIFMTILCLGLIFLGIRGRIDEKSPIRVGTAFFSNNAFLNQLGLNPNFTLIRSYLDRKDEKNKPIMLMDDSTAIIKVKAYLNIDQQISNSPIARMVMGDSSPHQKHNVVLIIMEGVSAQYLQRHGSGKILLPFLDSLTNEGLYFENNYSAGIHTHNGIFSTLFSFPALFHKHAMKESNLIRYNGMASTLKKSGYTTSFFIPHDGQFDNVEGFLRANEFDYVYSKDDYPSSQVKTTLGVPDDIMFSFSLPILQKLSQNNDPFFATFMTASNHGPFYIPEYFKPNHSEIKDQIIEYSDWSLRMFFKKASKQWWYKNTIFVITSDHGSPMDGTYSMPLSYNHTPLLFYNPGLLGQSKNVDNMAGQIDIFPTVMGILNLPYVNNTLGSDLLKTKRPYIYFSDDDQFGVIDHEWFLIIKKDGTHRLYKYQSKDKKDYTNEFPEIVLKMKEYGGANLQVYQHLLTTGSQYVE